MANVKWTGLAPAVAQVDTFTPGGTIEADDIFILTVTGADGTTAVISAAAGGSAASDVVTALKTAWNASTNPLCTPVTASGTDTLILTADVAGVPFSVAASTTEANGAAADDQTFIRAATVASAGPKHWDSAANWDTGVVPGASASQDVFIEDFSGDILYGLDQSGAAEALASLTIAKSFTGRLGVNGATGFAGTYLKIKSAKIDIGINPGPGTPVGSGRILIDAGSTASTITVHDLSTTPADTLKPACRLLADSASTVINILKGKVGIAFESGETATVGTVNITYKSTRASDADVVLGAGVTLTTLAKTGGTALLACGATTVTNDFGTLQTSGSGAITTLTVNGGTVTLNSTGTITTLNAVGGTTDLTLSRAARTVTTAKLGVGAILRLDPSVITLTNKVQPWAASGSVAFSLAAA